LPGGDAEDFFIMIEAPEEKFVRAQKAMQQAYDHRICDRLQWSTESELDEGPKRHLNEFFESVDVADNAARSVWMGLAKRFLWHKIRDDRSS